MAQYSLTPYSDKSVVLRSAPEDFFKQYSGHLTNCKGKWNPNLKDPPGSQNIKGGWIFPKTQEAQVRQTVEQIMSGALSQAPPRYAAQPSVVGTFRHPGLTLTTSQPAGPAASPGHQLVQAIRPAIQGTLWLEMNGQKHPIKIEQVTEEEGVVTSAVIILADGQRTMINLKRPEWTIPGLSQEHKISLI